MQERHVKYLMHLSKLKILTPDLEISNFTSANVFNTQI